MHGVDRLTWNVCSPWFMKNNTTHLLSCVYEHLTPFVMFVCMYVCTCVYEVNILCRRESPLVSFVRIVEPVVGYFVQTRRLMGIRSFWHWVNFVWALWFEKYARLLLYSRCRETRGDTCVTKAKSLLYLSLGIVVDVALCVPWKASKERCFGARECVSVDECVCTQVCHYYGPP